MNWEKIFANHIFDEALIFKIYKKIIQEQKIIIMQLKMGQRPERKVFQRKHTNVQQIQ